MSKLERYSLEQSESEALKMQNKIISGEAGNYAEAEELVEQAGHKKESNSEEATQEAQVDYRIVRNQELGVVYRERVTELPEHRKKVLGIDRIRTREIIELPKELQEVIEDMRSIYQEKNKWARETDIKRIAKAAYYPSSRALAIKKEKGIRGFAGEQNFNDKMLPILSFITDGRISGVHTWSHVLFGDKEFNPDCDYHQPLEIPADNALRRFKNEKTYQQKIDLKNSFDHFTGVFYSSNSDSSEVETIDWRGGGREKMKKHYEAGQPWLFDLSVSNDIDGKPYPRMGLGGAPIFYFGSKNKAFSDYIEAILNDPESIKLLKGAGWKIEDIENLNGITPKDPHYANKVYENTRGNKELSEKVISQKAISVASDTQFSTGNLRMLASGINFYNGNAGHPFIPVIRTKNVPELRWCHAELAVMPTTKSVKVLFFEKD